MNSVAVGFQYRAGETVQLLFTVVDDNGDPANITGMDVVFVLGRKPGETAVATTDSPANATATITNAAGGLYTVTFQSDYDFLGTYRFESWLEDGSGNKSEPSRGYLTFEPSLRR